MKIGISEKILIAFHCKKESQFYLNYKKVMNELIFINILNLQNLGVLTLKYLKYKIFN